MKHTSVQRWLATSALALALTTGSFTVFAQSGSAVDQVGEAFNAPAMGVSGLQSTARRQQPTDSIEALGALDDTRGLSASNDGPGLIARTVHVSLGQLRSALWYWLDSEERTRLNSVDLGNTANANTDRVRYFLADRALRRFAPMALAARRRRTEAVALRSASEVRDAAGALSASRLNVVAQILRRRETVEIETVREFAQRMERLGSAISRESPTDSERDRAADAAVVAAVEATRTGDIADVALTVAEASIAYGSRAERQVVVDEAIHLLEEAAAVARGNPTVERPLPPLPISIDPDSDLIVQVVHAARVRGHASTSRRGRPPATTTITVPRTGPSSQCYNDFRCFTQ